MKSCIYLPTSQYTTEELEAYMSGIAFPHLTTTQWRNLDSPLTLEELQMAVNALPNYKAPGEDGLPMEML